MGQGGEGRGEISWYVVDVCCSPAFYIHLVQCPLTDAITAQPITLQLYPFKYAPGNIQLPESVSLGLRVFCRMELST